VLTWPGRILILLITLVITSCVSARPQANFSLPSQTLLHKTVFIENNLEEWQQAAVAEALDEWECATNGMIHFERKFNSTEENSMFADPRYSFIIKNTSSDDPKIAKSDKERQVGTTTIGYYTKTNFDVPLILLVQERLLDGTIYRATVEHEIGHAFGLVHENDENSIMFPGVDVGAKHVTKVDLKQLCKLYPCKENEFKPCG